MTWSLSPYSRTSTSQSLITPPSRIALYSNMENRKSTPSLTVLPNEIIFQILTYLPPASVPTLQRVSQRFNELSQPLLWRYYCRTQFEYWSQRHQIQEKYAADVTKYDWKKIFSERHNIDRTTTLQLNSILSGQTSRIDKSERIVKYGYDAKDSLVRHLHVADDAEDVLARRYLLRSDISRPDIRS